MAAALTVPALTAAIAVSALAAARVISPRRYGETLGGLALGAGLAKSAIFLAGGSHG